MSDADARIAELEAKVESLEDMLGDLAGFVGRVANGSFGDDFKQYDDGETEHVVWQEVIVDEGSDHEERIGWWKYQTYAEINAPIEERVAAYRAGGGDVA